MNNFVARIICAAALLLAVKTADGQILDPIDVTFSTVTGEVESSIGISTPGLNSLGDTGDYLFIQGEDPDDPLAGLPADGTIVSASNTADKIATFQLAPYSGPDVLVGDGTLMLSAPASYSSVAFLVNSLSPGRFGAPATFTLNFSDGSNVSFSTGENVPNWIGGVPAVSGGSVALPTSAIYDGETPFNGSIVNFDEYDFTLPATDAGKILQSIDIGANGGELVTYAVSGMDPPSDAPEPPGWKLLALAGAVTWFFRRMRTMAGG